MITCPSGTTVPFPNARENGNLFLTISLCGLGHLHVVEYLLSDPSVGDLSRPGCPPGVVCAPTWQCAGSVQSLSRPPGESGPPVAAALQSDLSGRSRLC